MKARAASGAAVAAVTFLLAGCGSSDRDQVRSKVQQFAVAIAHRDAKTICGDVFAPSLVERFRGAGLSCQHGLQIFFAGLHGPTLAIGRITVHGSRASAVTLSGARGQKAAVRAIELVKTTDGWRILSLASTGGSANRGP